jgi:hypothetical protein
MKPLLQIVIGYFFMVKIRNLNAVLLMGTIGLTATLMTAPPAQAGWFDWLKSKPALNPYNVCTVSLNKATIEKNLAAASCAEVLHPDDMGSCVETVAAKKIESGLALSACRSVRRPLDLATCVTVIQKQDATAVLTDVLESCRRSLLPDRFGQCVVGLNGKPLQVATREGLGTCIDASDRPTDIELLRTFEPTGTVPAAPTMPVIRTTPTTPVAPTTTPNPTATPPVTTPQLF